MAFSSQERTVKDPRSDDWFTVSAAFYGLQLAAVPAAEGDKESKNDYFDHG